MDEKELSDAWSNLMKCYSIGDMVDVEDFLGGVYQIIEQLNKSDPLLSKSMAFIKLAKECLKDQPTHYN